MNSDNLKLLIELFINKAIAVKLISTRDKIYLRNYFYNWFNLSFTGIYAMNKISSQSRLTLVQLAQEIYQQLNQDQRLLLGNTEEQAKCNLIDSLLPLPGSIEEKFTSLCKLSNIKDALDWYYSFSKNTNYIQVEEISKNLLWCGSTQYGDLEVTINLSKPEKDPLEIAQTKLLNHQSYKYPKCLLCTENEGFAGNLNYEPRHNHRMLSITLNHQQWFFQYSPYSYFPEHAIIINQKHCDMLINQETFINMFDFVDLIPHYIIGSNSDIPIVGGSLLSHDHYQAGRYIFPIEKARVKNKFKVDNFLNLEINYLCWPLSTLQLIGTREEITLCAMHILEKWYNYNNDELEISAYTNEIRHNAITPIVRKLTNNRYVAYLILRNNRTNGHHPEGIFHPHRYLHHIKKENIGLIEAMGLAIFPGRLKAELEQLKKLLLMNDYERAHSTILLNKKVVKHTKWLQELYIKYDGFNLKNCDTILKQELVNKYTKILDCSGVFKNNNIGYSAMAKFIEDI